LKQLSKGEALLANKFGVLPEMVHLFDFTNVDTYMVMNPPFDQISVLINKKLNF